MPRKYPQRSSPPDGGPTGPEFGDPLASAQVDGDARKSVSTTRSVFFLLR
jgi:hypothetical protein